MDLRSDDYFIQRPHHNFLYKLLIQILYNQSSIGHFHMHENRKNKPFKVRSGGDKVRLNHGFSHPTYTQIFLPKDVLEK